VKSCAAAVVTFQTLKSAPTSGQHAVDARHGVTASAACSRWSDRDPFDVPWMLMVA
jgi:hypothetical protein